MAWMLAIPGDRANINAMADAHLDSPPPPRDKWQAPSVANHSATERFRGSRSAGRDAALIARLLDRFSPTGSQLCCLDVPSGTGRLRSMLTERGFSVAGADISRAMVSQSGYERRLLASAFNLPFETSSFDVVVCCRLLHHLPTEQAAEGTRELLRVSRHLVIASFWDSCSWHAWRRRRGLRVDRSGRRATTLGQVEQNFESAGARVRGHVHSFRYISQQAFVAASKDAP